MRAIDLPALAPRMARAFGGGSRARRFGIWAAKASLYPVSALAAFIYYFVRVPVAVLAAGCIVVAAHFAHDGDWSDAGRLVYLAAVLLVSLIALRIAARLYAFVKFRDARF